MKEINRNRRLFGAVAAMLFAGVIYAWSILKAPLAGEFGWDAKTLALNFTLTMCFFAVGGLIAGFAVKKTGPKVLIMTGGILAGAGFLLTSLNKGNPVALYLTYGVMGGLGIGLSYNPLVSSTNAWFTDRRGFSSGLLMMGFGASSLIIGNAADLLINAKGFGWRPTYRILGLLIGAVLALAGARAAFPENSGNARKGSLSGYDTKDVVRSVTFWLFYLYLISITAAGNVVISAARDIGMNIGMSAALATSLVGVLAVCNALGRLLSGAIFDRYGFRAAMTSGSVFVILSPLVILFALTNGSVAAGVAGLCVTGISYGFSPTVSSAVCGDFYGQKSFPLNFSIASTILIPTSFLATLVGSIVTETGSYQKPLVLLFCVSCISMILNLIIRKPAEK